MLLTDFPLEPENSLSGLDCSLSCHHGNQLRILVNTVGLTEVKVKSAQPFGNSQEGRNSTSCSSSLRGSSDHTLIHSQILFIINISKNQEEETRATDTWSNSLSLTGRQPVRGEVLFSSAGKETVRL